jgi:hypothetical protein
MPPGRTAARWQVLRRLALMAGAALSTAAALSGCGHAAAPDASSAPVTSVSSRRPTTMSTTSLPTTTPTTPLTTPTTSVTADTRPPSQSAPPRPTQAQLPLGGRMLFPAYRVVAYYGDGRNPTLGVLGRGGPDDAANAVARQAAQYAGYGRRIQPAMELITTLALASPGPNGDYSDPGDPAIVAQFLAAAKRHHELLILDFQPGRGEFLPQVQRYEQFLLDPAVGVALDPEWKVLPTQRPGGGFIGSASASSVNAVSAYLSQLVTAHGLPQKLFIVHQFTFTMLPDRANIIARPQLATVFQADGHSNVQNKIAIFHQLAFPAPPYRIGFKLFYVEDHPLMTPDQAMSLRPQPDLISYQ